MMIYSHFLVITLILITHYFMNMDEFKISEKKNMVSSKSQMLQI